MKNLLLILITLSTTILAKTPDSLFGVYINDNVLDYVTKEELKSKRRDIVRDFYYVKIKNPPVINKDYTDNLWVTFDKNNRIHSIQSDKFFQDSETCEKVEYGARRQLETKYNIEFVRNSRAKYGFQKWVGGKVLATECKVFGDYDTKLLIHIHTEKYSDKYNEYFNSNI